MGLYAAVFGIFALTIFWLIAGIVAINQFTPRYLDLLRNFDTKVNVLFNVVIILTYLPLGLIVAILSPLWYLFLGVFAFSEMPWRK